MLQENVFFRCGNILISLLLLQACASGPCYPLKHPELAQRTTAGAKSGQETKGNSVSVPKTSDSRVFVYKPDGSLQCGMGKGISPEEMEKQLDGIKVYSRENRPDGKMHIQVCGSPTGQVNVYEIPASSLKEAEKRGFKKFEP